MTAKERLDRFIISFSNNLVIKTVANGMMLILPVTLIGSILLIIQMLEFLPAVLINAATIGSTVTNSFIALYILIAMAFSLARELKSDMISSILLSVVSFFIVTPIVQNVVSESSKISAIDISYLGSKGIFVAMIISIFTTWLFNFLSRKGIVIKMPSTVPDFVSKSFAAILPGFIIVSIFIIIALLFQGTSYENLHDFVYSLLQTPLQNLGASIWSALILMFVSELLWWFGIHGGNVTASIIAVLYSAPAFENLEAVTAGEIPQNILNQFFLDVYKGPRALALGVILLVICKSVKFKSIGKISIVPSIFGITEPMKFGIPQILNPYLFIPLTLSAPLCILIAYVATIAGFLPVAALNVPKIAPPIISGFIEGGWQGIVIQVLQFVAVLLLYLPFMKKIDIQEVKLEESNEDN